MQMIVIDGIEIHQDNQGRYCINDLHRAAGGEKRHQPSDFLRINQTVDLIHEIQADPGFTGTLPVESVRGGLRQGTFVCRDLVTAYAMWINAKFHLKVIRTFEAAAKPVTPMTELSRLDLIQLALVAEQERLVLAAKVAADAPKVEFAEAVRAIDDVLHIGTMAKLLGFGRNRFFAKLREDGVLMADNKPYQKYMDRDYFRLVEQTPYKDSKGDTHAVVTTMVTGAGQVFLQRRYGAQNSRKTASSALTVMAKGLH